jgi:hypothetical protein
MRWASWTSRVLLQRYGASVVDKCARGSFAALVGMALAGLVGAYWVVR